MTVPPTATAGNADHILLVDDDPTNLDILRHALDGHGYKLIVLDASGQLLLRVALRARPSSCCRASASCRESTATRLAPPAEGNAPRLLAAPSSSSSWTRAKRCGASRLGRGLRHQALQAGRGPGRRPRAPDSAAATAAARGPQRRAPARAGRDQELLSEARRRVDGTFSETLHGVARVARVDRKPRGDPRPPRPQGTHGAGRRPWPRDPPRLTGCVSRSACVNCALLSGGWRLNRSPGRAGSGGAATQPARSRGARHPLLRGMHAGCRLRFSRDSAPFEAANRRRERGEPVSQTCASWPRLAAGPLSEGGFHTALLARLEARQLRVPPLAERTSRTSRSRPFLRGQAGPHRRLGAVVSGSLTKSLKEVRLPLAGRRE